MRNFYTTIVKDVNSSHKIRGFKQAISQHGFNSDQIKDVVHSKVSQLVELELDKTPTLQSNFTPRKNGRLIVQFVKSGGIESELSKFLQKNKQKTSEPSHILLQKALLKLGVTQIEFCKQANIHKTTLYRICYGYSTQITSKVISGIQLAFDHYKYPCDVKSWFKK